MHRPKDLQAVATHGEGRKDGLYLVRCRNCDSCQQVDTDVWDLGDCARFTICSMGRKASAYRSGAESCEQCRLLVVYGCNCRREVTCKEPETADETIYTSWCNLGA